MSTRSPLENQLKIFRQARGWSQEELARRAGISRTEISAIEIRRLVPSVATALALAGVLECRVDDLFALPSRSGPAEEWAWTPTREPCRFWRAEIGGRHILYPAESGSVGVVAHDGILAYGRLQSQPHQSPTETLVMACCDPAVGLLVRELATTSHIRLLVLKRSSSEALRLLGAGLVHLAGVHLASSEQSGGNGSVIRERLGEGFRLLKMARWEEGVALAPGSGAKTVRAAIGPTSAKKRWVGREVGSGARQCLDELFEGRPAPKRIARDHAGVAEAILSGWADLGVCLKLTAEEAGLEFLHVRDEAYDICYRGDFESDPRFQALLRVCRSATFRQLLGELPGYDVSHTGELESIA
jgi:molybdate-binding protein/transcriptional regulator with XRE-family HTH domain